MFLGAMMLPRPEGVFAAAAGQFPQAEKIGRICVGMEGAWFKLKTEPNVNAPEGGTVWRDDVLIWNREVVANQLDLNVYNQRWVETPAVTCSPPWFSRSKTCPTNPCRLCR